MASSAASPLSTDSTGSPPPLPASPPLPTRARYQRALCLLPRAWPELVRVHPELTTDDYFVLSRFLAMKPGWWQYQGRRTSCAPCSRPVAKGGTGKWTEVRASGKCRLCGAMATPRDVRPGLADEIGWSRARFLRATQRLRKAGLLLGELLTQRDRLPTGRHPTTNILRYFVVCHALESAAEPPPPAADPAPSGGSEPLPSPGSPRSVDAPSPTPPPGASQGSFRARPSSTDQKASETPPSEKAARPPRRRRRGDSPSPESAAPESERHRLEGEQAESHAVDALASQWDALRLPEEGGTVSVCRPSERAALRNRRREVGPEIVALAILGAGADEFLRRCPRRSAIAWVFASAERVRAMAKRGEEVAAERARDAEGAEARRAKAAADETRRELWARAPWLERTSPLDFREAMRKGDFPKAEAILGRVKDLGGGDA